MRSTARAMEQLRKDGWQWIEVVERWNPYSRTRHDLFNLVDVLAVCSERGTLAVQACGRDFASHRDKILRSPCSLVLVEAGWAFELWGFRKLKSGWTIRVEQFTNESEWTF